jgi:hypothetical protein
VRAEKLEPETPMSTARLTASPLKLIADAAGTPAEIAAKTRRLATILAGYADGADLDARLLQLKSRGYIESIPTRAQLAAGAHDMVRFWIVPAAADYYASKGIGFRFHQVLRFLDEPASLADPVGFFSTRDGIIGHLMQVVHANPLYDFQLLEMFDDGLDQLELQLDQMIAGTHPRARSIGAIVEEPDYHARLLAFTRAWRQDPTVPPMLRENVAGNDTLAPLERTFGTLPAAMRYMNRLPATVPGALRHALTVTTFPLDLAEPA